MWFSALKFYSFRSEDYFLVAPSDGSFDPDIGLEKCNLLFNENRENLEIGSEDKFAEPLDDDLGLDIEVDPDSDDDDDYFELPHKNMFSIEFADPLCIRFNELLSDGKISKDGILYKHLNDVVEITFDPSHQYCEDVLEFFNTVQYLGGNSTANFVRGPMRTGGGRNNIENQLPLQNFGGPSRPTRTKKKSGYTTKSGVVKELSLCQLKLSTSSKSDASFLVCNKTVKVIPCVLSNDGNALKPAIELDIRQKQLIGLDFACDYQYIKDNPSPSPEFLKSHIVVEVVISNITSLDNDSSMPVIAEYVPKQGKSGDNLVKSFIENICLVQTCERCQTRAKTDEHILDAKNVNCNSSCVTCLSNKTVCESCLNAAFNRESIMKLGRSVHFVRKTAINP